MTSAWFRDIAIGLFFSVATVILISVAVYLTYHPLCFSASYTSTYHGNDAVRACA